MASKLSPLVNKKDHIQGLLDSPLELVEYGDYQCSHCGVAYPIIKKIQKKFSKNLRFVFRNFPLSEAHEFAFQAAVAAEAAAKQNRFWEMHDILYEHQASLQEKDLIKYAQQLGLNIPHFEKDLADAALAEKVEADFESGVKSGVNGTPSFYINNDMYEGSYDYDSLLWALQAIIE